MLFCILLETQYGSASDTHNRPSAKVSLSNNLSKTIKQTRLRSNIVYNKGLDNVVELRIS